MNYKRLLSKAFTGLLCAVLVLETFTLPLAYAEEALPATPPEPSAEDIVEPTAEPSAPSSEEPSVEQTPEPITETTAEEPSVPVVEPVEEPGVETVEPPVEPITPAVEILEEEIVEEPVIDEQKILDEKSLPTYMEVMRKLSEIREKGELVLPEGIISQEEILKFYDLFVEKEEEKLSKLPVDEAKKEKYLEFLVSERANVENPAVRAMDKMIGMAVKDAEVKIPEKQPGFFSSNEDIFIKGFALDFGTTSSTQNFFKDILSINDAQAIDENLMPVIEDVKEDSGEVQINLAIQELAAFLNNNPVEILNYVRNNIDFEPYYGAKKGSVGCLIEKKCNDLDTTSLTIAIMRAAGIPARYKKGVAVIKIDQLEELLGIDSADGARTVFYAFKANKYPIYSISGTDIDENLDDADLTGETHFGVEWVYPEIFYDYDERGGNINNELGFDSAVTTEDVRLILAEKFKKQWIPLEPTLKKYTHTMNEIVADTANFNSENFWYGYLQYQGSLSPVEKYAADLLSATGKDINNSQYQSTKQIAPENLEILPYKTPYLLGSGTDSDGNAINIENWSVLPNDRRYTVRISLLNSDDQSLVFSNTFYGNEINNVELELGYQGATPADQQIIDSYGGIHATPAQLVNIVPYFVSDYTRVEGTTPIEIGDPLIMEFDYDLRGASVWESEKFSVAGNWEGIYVVLSRVQNDFYLDRPSKILFQGNPAMAREYLSKVEDAAETLEKSFDYQYNIKFSRAVITQNRVLSEVNGNPTTFDFNGLTIDAEAYINDYSNIGNYKNHRKDYHLLWGLYSSYYEGRLFPDLAKLEAISTVSGLQYAYANPATYTVHIINSNNESVIDSLALTENTKANMHADVQEGNTIITPNKFVEEGIWRGILYISLDDDWTGTYAIGEQVGNGGYSINPNYLTTWTGTGGVPQYAYQFDNGPSRYIYKDDDDKNISCSISVQTYNLIVAGEIAPAWDISLYGKPCMDDNENGPYQFGDHQHSFIIATNGAYFYSGTDGYNYWKTNDSIKSEFASAYPTEEITMAKLYPYWGTYVYEQISDGIIFDTLITLGVYNPKKEEVYKLIAEMAKEYQSEDKVLDTWTPGVLGYPEEGIRLINEYEITVFLFVTITIKDYAQKFTNGQMYAEGHYNQWIVSHYFSYYVIPQGIYSKYLEKGGLNTMGFPMDNPGWLAGGGGDTMYQDFENGETLTYNVITHNAQTLDNSQKAEILQNYEENYYEDMKEGIWDSFSEANLYGLTINFAAGLATGKIIEKLLEIVVKRLGMKVIVKIGIKFIPYVGWAYAGVTTALAIEENAPLYDACRADPLGFIEGKSPAYYCGRLGANLALAAIGITLDAITGKLNKLGARSSKGISGKSKLFASVENDTQWNQLRKALIGDSSLAIKSVRDKFFKRVDDLLDTDIIFLAKNPKISQRLLQEPIYIETFDGFIQSGTYYGKVKYRVDPQYSSQMALYDDPYNFNFQKLLNDGISKSGFYGINDLDDAIDIYFTKGLDGIINGKTKGEIIFVKLTNGTTILTPRYRDVEFPHPALAQGEDVISAGTIKPVEGTNQIIIDNQTGHYKIYREDIDSIITELTDMGYTVLDNSK